METIKVVRVIKASPEKVFDILSDHGNYKSFDGVKDFEQGFVERFDVQPRQVRKLGR